MFWGLSSKNNLKEIFVIQKRSIRSILRLRPTDFCYDHFLALGIMTVPSLYLYEIISYVVDHKLLPAHTQSQSQKLFIQKNRSQQNRMVSYTIYTLIYIHTFDRYGMVYSICIFQKTKTKYKTNL
jgi:hypothetical protein